LIPLFEYFCFLNLIHRTITINVEKVKGIVSGKFVFKKRIEVNEIDENQDKASHTKE
jgi:hypothetical protein